MKHNFMNKENGKIASVLVMYLDDDGHMQTDSYDKVEDLLEDYGAYKPAEPLIKDEKVRKVVRAWAEASGITKVLSYGDIFWIGFRSINTESVWKFECFYEDGSELKLDKEYTIAELCGEEE